MKRARVVVDNRNNTGAESIFRLVKVNDLHVISEVKSNDGKSVVGYILTDGSKISLKEAKEAHAEGRAKVWEELDRLPSKFWEINGLPVIGEELDPVKCRPSHYVLLGGEKISYRDAERAHRAGKAITRDERLAAVLAN